jgi:hypothetical protein
MAGLNDAGLNAEVSGLTSLVAYVSLHTADPGASGTSEVTGGSYARKSVSWAAASAGNVATNADITFDVPGSTTITHLGYWSAVTSGTFYGSRALDASQDYATDGTYKIVSGNLSESVS